MARHPLSRLWHGFTRRAGLALRLTQACIAAGLSAAVIIPNAAVADIVAARYVDPTTRYDHAILGDAIEYGALELRLSSGQKTRLVLPDTHVFEDIAPRLADIDGDGDAEVVVIETDMARGARLAVYDHRGLVVATPNIGRTHRWLAPVGVADLDGDGRVELAYVDRPHLARVLRIWRVEGSKSAIKLIHLSDTPGLTNHRIGENYISGGIRDCGQGPEMITADAGWQRIVASRFDGERLHSRILGRHHGAQDFTKAMACR